MIHWEAPGPYVVGFTDRTGGVSGGPYESLNLGALTEDETGNVTENRRRACASVGADAATATMAWQHHSSEVTRAEPRGIVTPGTMFERCDGLWSDEPGQAMMLLTADCLPVAIARTNGAKPALAILHVGWRGLLAGIVAAGARALGGGKLAAAIGPGIGPCCYEVGEDVAATKYVDIDDLAALAGAGIEVVGENRAQDLEAKHARHGDAFRWHFIGHLQSRKAKTVNELCELCHSLASESAARRLEIPALVEVNLSGEESKSGIPESELESFLSRYDDVRGLMTMPPETGDPEASRPYFKRLRELAERYGLRELSMGTSQDYRVAADEGATIVRLGSILYGS